MKPNTKSRSLEIFSAAVALVEPFGIETLDAMPQPMAKAQRRVFAHQVMEKTGCHRETARMAVAKACRRLRSPDWKPSEWGGQRPGSGRPAETE